MNLSVSSVYPNPITAVLLSRLIQNYQFGIVFHPLTADGNEWTTSNGNELLTGKS